MLFISSHTRESWNFGVTRKRFSPEGDAVSSAEWQCVKMVKLTGSRNGCSWSEIIRVACSACLKYWDYSP